MVILLHFLLANVASAASGPAVYDQRQSGKTNVRVEVKDALILAIGDGDFGGDYDYSYDYSDLTIKPNTPISPTSVPPPATAAPPESTSLKSTTVFPTSTSTFNITQNAAIVLEAENNSIIFPPSNLKPGNSSTNPIKITPNLSYKPDQIPVVVLQETSKPHKFLPVRTVEKQYLSSSQIRGKASNSSSANAEDLPPRRCSAGFFLDNHNRCKRIRREKPQVPIGLRFDHKPLTRS